MKDKDVGNMLNVSLSAGLREEVSPAHKLIAKEKLRKVTKGLRNRLDKKLDKTLGDFTLCKGDTVKIVYEVIVVFEKDGSVEAIPYQQYEIHR